MLVQTLIYHFSFPPFGTNVVYETGYHGQYVVEEGVGVDSLVESHVCRLQGLYP